MLPWGRTFKRRIRGTKSTSWLAAMGDFSTARRPIPFRRGTFSSSLPAASIVSRTSLKISLCGSPSTAPKGESRPRKRRRRSFASSGVLAHWRRVCRHSTGNTGYRNTGNLAQKSLWRGTCYRIITRASCAAQRLLFISRRRHRCVSHFECRAD